MALNITGHGGELRQGSRTLARLAGWTKQDKRITFTTTYVNEYLAGTGAAPTEIRIQASTRAVRVYPIVSGHWRDGAVHVDLMTARTETTL